MEGCVLLAIAIGALAATGLPVVPFCLGVLVALAVGLTAALLLFPNPMAVVTGAISLFAAVQIGYGLGLGLRALVRYRRSLSKKRFGTPPSKEAARHPR